MPPNEPKEPPSLTALSSDSDSWETRVRKELDYLLGKQSEIAALQEDSRRAWVRLAQLTRLAERRAEDVLRLAQAVEKDHLSRDRNTSALLECVRTLGERQEDVTYIRAGIDTILKTISPKKKSSLLLNGDNDSGKVGIVFRTINVFVNAPFRAQVMLWLLFATIAFAVGSWQGAKVYLTWEARQGAPYEERRVLQPSFAQPSPK
jgi:hypothetical protein